MRALVALTLCALLLLQVITYGKPVLASQLPSSAVVSTGPYPTGFQVQVVVLSDPNLRDIGFQSPPGAVTKIFSTVTTYVRNAVLYFDSGGSTYSISISPNSNTLITFSSALSISNVRMTIDGRGYSDDAVHFGYLPEQPPPPKSYHKVYLQSRADDGSWSNQGKVTVQNHGELALPNEIFEAAGTQLAIWASNPKVNGVDYRFVRWETSGGISLSDHYSLHPTLTINGEGTLTMVAKANPKEIKLEISPSYLSVRPGDRATYVATITATKIGDQEAFYLYIHVDGLPKGTTETRSGSLYVNYQQKTTTVQVGINTDASTPAGIYALSITAGVTGMESVKDTRQVQLEVLPQGCPPNCPDLTITDVSWSPSNPKPGDSVTFTYTERNDGNADASSHTVTLAIDGGKAGGADDRISSLKSGQSITRTFSKTWTATEGRHEITVRADINNEVKESNEDNNSYSTWITVDAPAGLANLRVLKIEMNPYRADSSYEQGQRISFYPTIFNEGKADANNFTISFYLDGRRIDSVSGQNLASGQYSSSVGFLWTATEGVHTIRMVVDDTGTVVESNENDNELSATVTVTKPLKTRILLIEPQDGSDAASPVTFKARVLDGGGNPVIGTRVSFLVDGKVMGTATTDSSGTATLKASVSEGLHEWSARASGAASGPYEFEVPGTKTVKTIKLTNTRMSGSAEFSLSPTPGAPAGHRDAYVRLEVPRGSPALSVTVRNSGSYDMAIEIFDPDGRTMTGFTLSRGGGAATVLSLDKPLAGTWKLHFYSSNVRESSAVIVAVDQLRVTSVSLMSDTILYAVSLKQNEAIYLTFPAKRGEDYALNLRGSGENTLFGGQVSDLSGYGLSFQSTGKPIMVKASTDGYWTAKIVALKGEGQVTFAKVSRQQLDQQFSGSANLKYAVLGFTLGEYGKEFQDRFGWNVGFDNGYYMIGWMVSAGAPVIGTATNARDLAAVITSGVRTGTWDSFSIGAGVAGAIPIPGSSIPKMMSVFEKALKVVKSDLSVLVKFGKWVARSYPDGFVSLMDNLPAQTQSSIMERFFGNRIQYDVLKRQLDGVKDSDEKKRLLTKILSDDKKTADDGLKELEKAGTARILPEIETIFSKSELDQLKNKLGKWSKKIEDSVVKLHKIGIKNETFLKLAEKRIEPQILLKVFNNAGVKEKGASKAADWINKVADSDGIEELITKKLAPDKKDRGAIFNLERGAYYKDKGRIVSFEYGPNKIDLRIDANTYIELSRFTKDMTRNMLEGALNDAKKLAKVNGMGIIEIDARGVKSLADSEIRQIIKKELSSSTPKKLDELWILRTGSNPEKIWP